MASSTRPRLLSLWQLQLLLATLYAIGDISLSGNSGGQVTTRSDLVVVLLVDLAQIARTVSGRILEGVVAALRAVIVTADHTLWYSYNFIAHHWGLIGLMAAVLYIVYNHGAILWCKALPALVSYVWETNFWPWPLRRRSVRRRLYRKYGDAMWAILALLVFALMLSNSAAKPSTTADKWFAKTSAQLPVHRTATKQSDVTPTKSKEQLPSAPSAPLLLQASVNMATHDATLGVQNAAEDCERQATAANMALPQQMQPMSSTANPAFTAMRAMPDIVPEKALMKAQSRAVMLLPVLPTCRAKLMVSKTVLEAPHMLVVRPFRVPSILSVLSAHAVPQVVTQPLPAIAPVSTHNAAVEKGLHDSSLRGSTRSPSFLDLNSWSPLRKLLLGACMFWLGIVIPGLRLWLTRGGDILAAGAAIAPAESEDPMSLKIERAGKKARHVLKRTTTSLISTRWTGDHATTPTMSPSPAPPLVHQGQHSLVDADSILPHEASTLTDAASMDQVEDSTSEAPFLGESSDIPPVSAATHDESAAPAQHAPSSLAPAVELPVAEEPVPAADCPEQLALTSHEVQPAQPGYEHAAPAQPGPPQPTAAVEPVQHMSASPPKAQPAAPLKPDTDSETPARVPFLADTTPKAALPAVVPQVALPQTRPAAVEDKHSPKPLVADHSIDEDKVVSNGCFGRFCCYKASRRGKSRKFGSRA